MRTVTDLEVAYNAACEAVDKANKRADKATDGTDEARKADEELRNRLHDAERISEDLEMARASEKARAKYKLTPLSGGGLARMSIDEPDMYSPTGRSFLVDLYQAQLRNDLAAAERINRHHMYELEKRAISTGTMGGIVPPQYLVELYARAPRNGRVFADQAFNRQDMPDQGMSLIVPRLTAGTAAGIQASEGDVVTTQDPTETDLTAPVRTIAGYVPVSRQTLERAAYSEQILFEDLVARYYAALDVGLLNGVGTGGTLLGVLHLSGVNSVNVTSTDGKVQWINIADGMQQINSAVGGLGYDVDRIFMHPRRWAAFLATVDDSHRPLFTAEAGAINIVGQGNAGTYGRVGTLLGVPVYSDANIPTNLTNDGSSNEDAIIITSSGANLLFERNEDPITLAFEQQAGTSLMVQLIAYGYAAVASRFPAAVSVLTGSGLTTPSFS